MGKRDNVSNSALDDLSGNDYDHNGNLGSEGEKLSAVGKLDRLLTIQEVCKLLQVKKTYVYWLTYQKKIPHIKMQGHLRFRESAIDEWLKSQEVCNADS